MTRINFEQSRPRGVVLGLEFDAETVAKWAVSYLEDETMIRDTINRLEVKLKEMKALAVRVKENQKPREVTPEDVYSNRARGSFLAGD